MLPELLFQVGSGLALVPRGLGTRLDLGMRQWPQKVARNVELIYEMRTECV